MFLKIALKQLLLPPGLLIVGILLGLAIWLVAKRRGRAIVVLCAALLFLTSLPITATGLMGLVQGDTRVLGQVTDEQAIVILSAGVNYDAAEYGEGTIDVNTLERVRYGALLHHKSKLPVLVTGGLNRQLASRGVAEASVAHLMARSLNEEFQVPVTWIEPKASNTAQNAKFSAELLEPEGIKRILLVTHGWHMPRSKRVFEKAGFDVTAAPTGMINQKGASLFHYVPSAEALRISYYAFHEMVGGLYYRIRF